MKTTIPAYPDEIIGAGLLLLRLSLASVLMDIVHAHLTGQPALWLASIASALIAAGAFTRWTAALSVLTMCGLGWAGPDTPSLAGATSFAVLLLTGPGAYSVDAVAWGRLHKRFRPPPKTRR
jgi:hypothetical protein